MLSLERNQNMTQDWQCQYMCTCISEASVPGVSSHLCMLCIKVYITECSKI